MAANIVRTGTPHLADVHAPVRFTAPTGVALTTGCGVYLTSGGVWALIDKTVCTIANVSKWYGIVINACSVGAPATAFGIGAKIWITDTAQTIGTFWYVSATPGDFYDAAVASADTYLPCFKMITANVCQIVRGGV